MEIEPGFHDPAEDHRASYERHPVEDMEPSPESPVTALGDLLAGVLVWLAEKRSVKVKAMWPNHRKRKSHSYFCPPKTNLRTLAFLYCVRPDLTGSLRDISARAKCSPEAIRKHVEDFRKQFKFHTAGQWSDDARAKLRKAE